MKIIIAGSRDITDYDLVKSIIIESNFNITEVVSGCCRGVDTLGERFAIENNILIKNFKPNWKSFGLYAGILRNKKMSEYADGLIAISKSPISKGTLSMVKCAREHDLKVYFRQI